MRKQMLFLNILVAVILSSHPNIVIEPNHSPITRDNLGCLRTLAYINRGFPTDATFSPNGRLLALSTSIGIWLYDTTNFSAPPILLESPSYINSIAFSPNSQVVAAATVDGRVYVWRVSNGQLVQTLEGNAGIATQLAFSPEGGQIAVGFDANTVQVWYWAEGQRLYMLQNGIIGAVTKIHYSPDGTQIITADEGAQILVWDARSGDLFRRIATVNPILSIAKLSPNRYLVRGERGNQALFIDEETGQTHIFQGNISRITRATFSPDARQVAIVGRNYIIEIWNVENGTLLHTLQTEWFNDFSDIVFSLDGRYFVTIANEGVMLWNASTAERITTVGLHFGDIGDIAFHPDSRHVGMITHHKEGLIWSLDENAVIKSFPIALASYIDFNPNGQQVAISGSSGTTSEFLVWDITTGQAVDYLEAADEIGIREARFSPNGQYLVAIKGNQAWLWDAISGSLTWTFSEYHKAIIDIDFSPDSQRLVLLFADGMIVILDATSGTPTNALAIEKLVFRVLFSPDNQTVVLQSNDTYLWNVDEHTLQTLTTDGFITDIDFTSDGKVMFWALHKSDDAFEIFDNENALIAWDVARKELIYQANWDDVITLSGLVISPDGRYLITNESGGTTRLWAAICDS